MKKTVLLLLLTVCSLNVHAGKYVFQDGTILRDSTGKQIRLNGVNLGGWLLWEGWIWGGGFTKESTIQENLAKLAGEATADSFRIDIWRNFISENDIKAISENGLNVVRIPFNHRIFDPVQGKIYGWEILDNVLSWCRKYHVYAVLDMHSAPGGQSPYFIADPIKQNLWRDPHERTMTVQLWKEIAAHYANENIIAGYDLLNEPIPAPRDSLTRMYERIIAGIRSVDQNHLLILEGANFAKDFTLFTKMPDRNMMLSFHMYTWLGGDPASKIETFSALTEKFDVPVWCGEFGENNYEVIDKTLQTFSNSSNHLSGWCFWTWKKVLNSYPALNGINITDSWRTVIKWCASPSTKNCPGHDVAVAAMREFETDILFENTKHDERMMEVLHKYCR